MADGGGPAAHFTSAQGEAVVIEERMEALAGPGAIYVHRSALHKWAAEARRPPPAAECVAGAAAGGRLRLRRAGLPHGSGAAAGPVVSAGRPSSCESLPAWHFAE